MSESCIIKVAEYNTMTLITLNRLSMRCLFGGVRRDEMLGWVGSLQIFSVESLDNDERSEHAVCNSRAKMGLERLKNTELREIMQEEQHESGAMVLLHFSRLQIAFRRNLNDSDALYSCVIYAQGSIRGWVFAEVQLVFFLGASSCRLPNAHHDTRLFFNFFYFLHRFHLLAADMEGAGISKTSAAA